MPSRLLDNRFVLLASGLMLGLGISFYWPHEPLKADSTSLDKFSLCTAPTIANNSDAVFVLDSITGRLVGASHNMQTNTFTQVWTRSVAADFGVVENAKYVMASGFLRTLGSANGQPATSGIYVAELTSGRVGLYGFLMNNRGPATAGELVPVANFSFREGK